MTAAPPYGTVPPIHYTPVQLGAVAMSAGVARADLETAIAIALAESSGNATAIGPLVKTKDVPNGMRPYGCMQIEWPTWQDTFTGGIGSGYWMNAQESFRQAMVVKGKQGWGAWSTYTTKAYKIHLAQAADAVAQLDKAIAAADGNVESAALTIVGNSIISNTAAQELSWSTEIGLAYVSGALGGATTSILGEAAGAAAATGSSAALVRTLEVVLGGVLLLVGLYQLTRPVTAPIQSAALKAAAVIK